MLLHFVIKIFWSCGCINMLVKTVNDWAKHSTATHTFHIVCINVITFISVYTKNLRIIKQLYTAQESLLKKTG
jgi:hypothetical protein